MDDAYRFQKEAEVAQAVMDAFDGPASPGVRAGLVAAKVEPILRQVEQDEAAAALMLILISLEDDDFGGSTTSLQRALPAAIQTRSYSHRRAQKLGDDLARSEAEATASADPPEQVMTPERAEGIGITEVTGAGSAGGLSAREVAGGAAGEQGTVIDFIWRTREDARVCLICAPLNGQREAAWRDRFPLGPPGHPRCRCVAQPFVRQRRSTSIESIREAFNEEDHPRGDDGRFISKGDIAAAKDDDAKAAELFAKTTDPEQRARLEKAIGKKAPATKTINPKVHDWARKKFGDEHKAKAFAEWFGNSKVVDEKGDPLVVYHGTNADFEEFERSAVRNGLEFGDGTYLTSDPDRAALYAKEDGANIKPVYVRAAEPLDYHEGQLTDEQVSRVSAMLSRDMQDEAKGYVTSVRTIRDFTSKEDAKAFYDEQREKLDTSDHKGVSRHSPRVKRNGDNWSIEYSDTSRVAVEKDARRALGTLMSVYGNQYTKALSSVGIDAITIGDIWLVTEPTQIKSATGNRGTFDPSSPNINEARRRVAGGAAGEHRNPVESFRDIVGDIKWSDIMEAFNEEDHPRGDDGRFISKGAISAALKDPHKASLLRAKVTDPKERLKLDRALRAGKKAVAPPQRKPKSAIAKRALAHHVTCTKAMQDESEQWENKIAKSLGLKKSGDNLPMDNFSEDGKVGVEIKVLHKGDQDRVQMRKGSRQRKEAWTKAVKGRKSFTVLIDNRDKFEGGAHKSKFSGHRIYVASGVGAFRLGSMTKARSFDDVRALIGSK